MVSKKIKERKEDLIDLVSSFSNNYLNEDYTESAVKIVEKMARKREVPFRRGKLEIWASGIIYALAQINFLFDKTSPYYISADDICNHFNTKKSTVSKKADQIIDMLDLSPLDGEFTVAPIIPEVMHSTGDMDDFFDEAFELYARGKVSEAIKHIDSIKEDNPEYGRALFYKSMFLAESDEREAFNLFQEALHSEFSNNLEFDLEEEDVDELIDELVDYDNPEELEAVALLNFNTENYDRALYYLDLALKKDKDNDELLYYKSLSLANLGEFKKAIKTIDKAIKINPDCDRYWNDKGSFLGSMNHVNKAVKCFDKAIKLNPEDSVIWANKGFLYLQNGKYQKALDSYDKACQLELNVHNIIGKVNVYIEVDDFENAEKCLNKAGEIDDEDMEYLMAKAQLLMNQQHLEESIIYWDKCLEIDDEFAQAWFFKGLTYGLLDNDDEFEYCIDKACELDPMIVFAFDNLIE